MAGKKNIFVIVGSASEDSANHKIINLFAELAKNDFNVSVYKELKALPHFDPQVSIEGPPEKITEVRNEIQKADGIVICTPEYIFSIPSGLKNVIEWCVSTDVFDNKPTALITASANGEKGHEQLKLIMQTVMAKVTDQTNLLIPGIKGKINGQGEITNPKTIEDLMSLIINFKILLKS
ncbi:NADPH-dependent FMN reductase [Flavobacterium wongokense]|uniref:NADPH-dependent FMN reductase n=1 Tax=Flavobacterium wongokense TaxID=2910674 RepID=UPI001F1AEB68|nr:NADPH-dependent FMN reductase [Flavobacterium sp. WG47]MCF6132775.1 NAD(P)H-dependent oxidoreductase [Flavobacterium sp. WG47]